MSPALGDQKGMICNKQHCLGSNANEAYIQMVDQEYIKVSMDKCLLVIFALSTQDVQSRIHDRHSRKSTRK
jgi:hypothetical protein